MGKLIARLVACGTTLLLAALVAVPVATAAESQHPSGKDRTVEKGGSGTQGKATSDPDGASNGGADKPGQAGGADRDDQDGNNGCGNDQDFEDDNKGNCGGKKKGKKGGSQGGGGSNPGKVTICHRTGSESNPWRIITVSKSAEKAHMAHGDKAAPASGNAADCASTSGGGNGGGGNGGGGNGGGGGGGGETVTGGAGGGSETVAGEAAGPGAGGNAVAGEAAGPDAVAGQAAAGEAVSAGGKALPFTGLATNLALALGTALLMTGAGLHVAARRGRK